MAAPIWLRDDFDAARLRDLAKTSRDPDQLRRLLSLAEICDGGSRGDAARISGVGRQTVRDWVLRFNAGGPKGLIDPKSPGKVPKLNKAQRQALVQVAGRGGTTIKALAVHDGSHRRVERQPFGIVHVLVSGQAAEHRLAQQARQQVARVLAAPQVRQRRPGDLGQAENIVQLAVGQEASVRGDLPAVEFQFQAAVEIDPQMGLSGFTRRVRRI